VSDIDAALLAGWNASEPILIADTRTGRIFRVRLSDGSTAVVKVLRQVGIDYELRGADFLAWRDGLGCARLLASHGATLLLEDVGNRSLLAYLSQYGDAAATAIAAEAVVAIHGASSRPTPATLQPLKGWFASLFALAVRPDVDDLFAHGARIARSLLDDERDVRPLHGDLHHENLFHTRRGWLAIPLTTSPTCSITRSTGTTCGPIPAASYPWLGPSRRPSVANPEPCSDGHSPTSACPPHGMPRTAMAIRPPRTSAWRRQSTPCWETDDAGRHFTEGNGRLARRAAERLASVSPLLDSPIRCNAARRATTTP
jgi:hypothetical protein